ncbi:hypothetical protein PIB30_004992 [Stylosanthes scabra]|uniref:Uncharacterized protein n=1 Tax=Stylosanthes scabra TaxID=79078 RepID=A0ABU6X5H4_9FABA|nr:hypothetical protein [Stylosanthes scabra]
MALGSSYYSHLGRCFRCDQKPSSSFSGDCHFWLDLAGTNSKSYSSRDGYYWIAKQKFAPVPNVIKLNCDASVLSTYEIADFGYVLCDCSGSYNKACTDMLPPWNIHHCELFAI